jgi:hypothetical protein
MSTAFKYCFVVDKKVLKRASCTVKNVSDIPVPSRDVTYQTLPWEGKIKLFPHRESLVSDIPAGDGNVANIFLRCRYSFAFFCFQW